MNRELLAAWVADLEPATRNLLAATLRAGMHELQADRRRNGASYDATPATTLMAALASAQGERYRSVFGQPETRWLTIGGVLSTPSRGLAPSTLRRWASTGQVRARKAGKTYLIDADDLARKLREDAR